MLEKAYCISIHAPLAGRDGPLTANLTACRHFNPRAPCGARRPSAKRKRLRLYFNPRAPCGARRCIKANCGGDVQFQSTHPLRGATRRDRAVAAVAPYFNPRTPCGVRRRLNSRRKEKSYISIHAPLAGCDVKARLHIRHGVFQSTHPLRGATAAMTRSRRGCCYFNPRTPCGVRLVHCNGAGEHHHFNPRTPCGVRLLRLSVILAAVVISIHAPLAGCDGEKFLLFLPINISIHAPLAGCDAAARVQKGGRRVFQSTHPLRGATGHARDFCSDGTNFNPRTPCGVRRRHRVRLGGDGAISIHAPLAGCDAPAAVCAPQPRPFQSTHPLRGATRKARSRPCGRCYFNPRTPCGVRPLGEFPRPVCYHFNPRTPCGVRPFRRRFRVAGMMISIHAPLAGCDRVRMLQRQQLAISIHAPLAGCDFAFRLRDLKERAISIHAPLAGCDFGLGVQRVVDRISIHAPLAGCDSKFDEFLSANLHKSNKRDLLSEEKMRHGLPRTTCMSHFRSFFGCEAEAVFCPLALRT